MSKQTQKFAENAANSFMAVSIGVGRWTGVAGLKDASSRAAEDAGANPASARLYVNLLGSHHALLADVNAAYAAIRTYYYAHTLPFTVTEGDGQSRGDRIIPVTHVPRVMAKLQELADTAQSKLDAFIPEYERLVRLAQSEDMGTWRSEARRKYPTADSVRAKFYAHISPPRPLASFDPERLKSMGLPLEMAEKIAEAGTSALNEQLEVARTAAMEQARQQMDRVAKQLTSGKRLHESLVTDSKRVAQLLRDMTEGYDRDPQIMALVKLIEDKVATVENTGQWKASETRRAESAKAAATVRDGLKRLAGAARGPVPDKSPKAARVRAGGIMGRKLAAGKAKAKKS